MFELDEETGFQEEKALDGNIKKVEKQEEESDEDDRRLRSYVTELPPISELL